MNKEKHGSKLNESYRSCEAEEDGIEPSFWESKSHILPLDDSSIKWLVNRMDVNPAYSLLQISSLSGQEISSYYPQPRVFTAFLSQEGWIVLAH